MITCLKLIFIVLSKELVAINFDPVVQTVSTCLG